MNGAVKKLLLFNSFIKKIILILGISKVDSVCYQFEIFLGVTFIQTMFELIWCLLSIFF